MFPPTNLSQPTTFDYTKDFTVEETTVDSTPMLEYYRGKVVFLTGGTGFLGQLFVEKLLRIKVKQIYLLARPKKGKTPEDRLKEIFSGVLFAKLTKMDPDYLKRIRVIEGDTAKLQAGISNEDLEDIYENVQIVLHAAADVRFDEVLRKLLLVNLRGTRELLKMTEKIKNLEAFTYVSTGFSHCTRPFIEEKFYNVPVDPDVMIKVGEKYADSESFDTIQQRIISPWPNTYVYTKSLCEELVRRHAQKFPICIIRPTIVIATHEDPLPAWCNNIYGLNGILVACGMGVLRLMPLNCNLIGDIVCADFVTNSTLAATWYTYEEFGHKKLGPGEDPEIYHVCSSADRPLKWGIIHNATRDMFSKYPAKGMLWKHCPNTTICPFMEKLLTVYYHVIPAFVMDMFFTIKKDDKPQKLMPVYRKVQRFTGALKYFMTNEFTFSNSNMRKVLNRMTKEDQEYFPSDIRRWDWLEYCYDYVNGLKLYIGGENLNNLEASRKWYAKLCVAHYGILFLYYGIHIVLFYMLSKYFGLVDYVRDTVHDVYEFF